MLPLTLAQLTAGATAALDRYQRIGGFIDARRIKESAEANWPDAPPPLVFWLWMSQSDLIGRLPTQALLGGLEGMLAAFETGRWVDGDWRGRVRKLIPPREKSGFDHYSNFRSALFELNLAVRLVASSKVTIQPDGSERGCDLLVRDAAGPVVEVEAYAPQRGVRLSYDLQMVADWNTLVRVGPSKPFGGATANSGRLTMNPDAVLEALEQFLKIGNFGPKRQQLASAKHPSLLAIRGYGLTPRLEEVLTTPSARDFAAQIEKLAWDELPSSCLGLLFSLQGDVVSQSSPLAAVISPDRTVDERVAEYLYRVGALHRE